MQAGEGQELPEEDIKKVGGCGHHAEPTSASHQAGAGQAAGPMVYKSDTGEERDPHQAPLSSPAYGSMLGHLQTHSGHTGSVDTRLGSADAKLEPPDHAGMLLHRS
jgi:hypothetical protein